MGLLLSILQLFDRESVSYRQLLEERHAEHLQDCVEIGREIQLFAGDRHKQIGAHTA